MAILSIDLGGTKTKMGLVDKGSILATTTVNSMAGDGIEANLVNTMNAVRSYLNQINFAQSGVEAIGVALPVIVDSKKNTVLSRYVKYHDAFSFDFNDWFQKNWNVHLQLENDARAALLGEWQFGAGKGCDNLAILTLGTGVGSAALIDGRILRGKHYLGGNMAGHVTINFDGVACNCGSKGCLETEASTWALPSIWDRISGTGTLENKSDLDFEYLLNEMKAGNETAKAVFDHCANAWGACAANLVHNFDPERIIVSGGIMKSASRILPVMQHYVDTRAWLAPGTVKVVAATQPDFSALLGMAYLITNE